MPNLLLVIRSGPEHEVTVREALDAALVCAAFGMEMSILFAEDGVRYITNTPNNPPTNPPLFTHCHADDFVRIMVQADAPATGIGHLPDGLVPEWLSAREALQSIRSHREVMVA